MSAASQDPRVDVENLISGITKKTLDLYKVAKTRADEVQGKLLEKDAQVSALTAKVRQLQTQNEQLQKTIKDLNAQLEQHPEQRVTAEAWREGVRKRLRYTDDFLNKAMTEFS
jgi:septal ring factor EnvC (AmiA/AmiB activator)